MTLEINWKEAHKMYLKNLSLLKTAEHYNCSISTVYRNFAERGWKVYTKMESKIQRGYSHKLKSDKFGRVYIRVNGQRIKRAQYNWEKKNGLLPKGKVLHHINLNIKDDREENLRLMSQSEHVALHNRLRGASNRD